VQQRGPGDPSDPRDVDVEHAGPLVVAVPGDVADRPDARIVRDDVEAAQLIDNHRDGLVNP
jgi:hypothetical protein